MALEERELADPDELGERRNRQYERGVKRFQGGLVSKAHRVLYNSTLGSRVIKKKKKKKAVSVVEGDLDELGERRNVVRPFLRTIELLEARLHFAGLQPCVQSCRNRTSPSKVVESDSTPGPQLLSCVDHAFSHRVTIRRSFVPCAVGMVTRLPPAQISGEPMLSSS